MTKGSWDQETIPERVKVSEIIVDKYQGHVNKGLVGHIAKNWDEDAAGAVVLNLRKDGTYAAVDGQHRVLAARMAGIDSLRALVFIDKTTKEEAELFVKLNKKHNVLPIDRFRANLEAGCVAEKAIQAALKDAGLELALHGPGHNRVQCAGELVKIYTNWGLVHFRQVVGIVAAAYKGYTDPKAYVSEAFGGVSHVLVRYPQVDTKRVIQKLSERPPVVMLGMASVKKDRGQENSVGWAKALIAVYNTGYRQMSKAYLDPKLLDKKVYSLANKEIRQKSEAVKAQLKLMRAKSSFQKGAKISKEVLALRAARTKKKA